MINRTALRRAAKQGGTRAVKAVWKDGFDVNSRFVHEWTLLHFAAKGGNAETVSFFLSKGADANNLNELWRTPLDETGNAAVSKCLRDAGGKKGVEAFLHAAAFWGDLKWVKKHVTSGTDLNGLLGGELPVCIALRRHRSEVVRFLLRRKADVTKQESNGATPLHAAAECDADESTMKTILQMGADVNATDKWGHTPVCSAARAGDLPAVDFLIKHGTNLKRRFPVESSPVAEAVDSGHFEIARRLIDEGARASLFQAVECGHLAATKRLIQQGADLEKNESEWSGPPLFAAIKNDWLEVAELLLDSGADPDAQKATYYGRHSLSGGDTPLHQAVYAGSAKMVILLLSYGADPDFQDAEQLSPLELARRRCNTHLVHLMEAHLDRKISQNAVEQLYTTSKVADLLSVDLAFIAGLVKTGKLRQINLDPETVRIPASSLTRYLASVQK